jgi:hypothetical protein
MSGIVPSGQASVHRERTGLIFPGGQFINKKSIVVEIEMESGETMLRTLGGLFLFLFLCFTRLAAQETPGAGNTERQTIPELLRQPQRGEAPRYPVDMIIGSLERGDVPAAAYTCAREVMGALVAKNREAAVFSSMNNEDLEKIFSDLGKISPQKFRLGKGREEADEAVSFLVRFMGREKGMVGELYVRLVVPPEEEGAAAVQDQKGAIWRLDDLILEEERGLDEVVEDRSFDLPPYERFF